jgi:hypothetical protein
MLNFRSAAKAVRAPFVVVFAICGIVSVAVAATNAAPKISGAPPAKIATNKGFYFRPTSSDANGDKLTFSIKNKPSWITFSRLDGSIMGTPTSAATYYNIVIAASDGKASAALKAFSLQVVGSTTGNHTPTIAGSPPTSGKVGTAYSFQPTAGDADKNALGFSVANKPSWASFSTMTGKLSGTPTATGTFANILISVSDGTATAKLPAFSINVGSSSGPPPTGDSATLSWNPPTQNSDGSALTSLAGYRIYYGTNASSLNKTISVGTPGITTYVISGLSPGTYYFAITAYNSSNNESGRSNVMSKVIS